MSPFLHSLPWTLALTLAAQGAETVRAEAKSETVQTTTIQTGDVKDKAWYEARFPDIARKDLQENMKSGTVVLIDANGSKSYAEGHLPGAMDFEASEADAAELAGKLPSDKGALIVAYCGGPGCRAWNRAADKLDAMGYTNVRHYKGGLKEWKSSGGKLEKPAKSG